MGLSRLTDTLVRRELEVVVGLELDDVGEKVGSLEDEVLDDEVDLLVGVLDSRDGDVSDLVDDRGENLVLQVFPEVGLKRKQERGN